MSFSFKYIFAVCGDGTHVSLVTIIRDRIKMEGMYGLSAGPRQIGNQKWR